MAKKKNLALLAAATTLAITGIVSPQTVKSTETNQSSTSAKANQREGVSFEIRAPRVESQQLTFMNSTQRGTAGRVLNQRQYRKLVRQCPHIRRSKKCRIK